MSSLVDIWTSEVGKLREKGDESTAFTFFTKGGKTSTEIPAENLDHPIPSRVSAEKTCPRSIFKSKFNDFASFCQAKKLQNLHCSDAAVSMLVDCFSP